MGRGRSERGWSLRWKFRNFYLKKKIMYLNFSKNFISSFFSLILDQFSARFWPVRPGWGAKTSARPVSILFWLGTRAKSPELWNIDIKNIADRNTRKFPYKITKIYSFLQNIHNFIKFKGLTPNPNRDINLNSKCYVNWWISCYF